METLVIFQRNWLRSKRIISLQRRDAKTFPRTYISVTSHTYILYLHELKSKPRLLDIQPLVYLSIFNKPTVIDFAPGNRNNDLNRIWRISIIHIHMYLLIRHRNCTVSVWYIIKYIHNVNIITFPWHTRIKM